MKDFKSFFEKKGESWEDGFKRRVVKTLNQSIKKMVINGE